MSKESNWKKHLQAWKTSGESVAAYCRRENLATSSFDYWRKRLKDDRFVRVGEPARIELALEDGTTLRLPADAAILQTVLEVLRAAARR